MGRLDWRGEETIGVLARISARLAEPRESRANGYSRGSDGFLLFVDFFVCVLRISFFINLFFQIQVRFIAPSLQGARHAARERGPR